MFLNNIIQLSLLYLYIYYSYVFRPLHGHPQAV